MLETFCQRQQSYRDGLQRCEKWILQKLGGVSQNVMSAATYEMAMQELNVQEVSSDYETDLKTSKFTIVIVYASYFTHCWAAVSDSELLKDQKTLEMRSFSHSKTNPTVSASVR